MEGAGLLPEVRHSGSAGDAGDRGGIPGPARAAAGLLTRMAALGIAVVMIMAIFRVHRHPGYFMNWYGNQGGEGFDYHLLVLGLAVALIIGGAGAWSLDALVAQWGNAS